MLRRFEPAHIVPALCVLAILGAALYSVFEPAPNTPELTASENQKIVVQGIVVADPDVRAKTIYVTLDVEKINDAPAKGRILVSVDRFSEVAYGDRISATGTLKKPEPFETDTERVFDYPKYLRAHGITHTLSFVHFSKLESGQGNAVVAWLLSAKHFFLNGIQTALPEPESALLAGLLLGEKQSLGDEITDAFRKAGVVHIIVLSGYNVALVINAVLFIALYFLPRAWALSIAGIAILGFAVMTGASETTIRASVMALIVLFARFLHRPTDGIRILLLAAAGMAIWNPFLVLYDLSYQLSILATLGLILFSDRIAKRISFVPETLGLREIIATTLGTQVTVLPLLIFSVGQVSLVSLVTNILVLPAVPLSMLLGFLASLLALLNYGLAFPFAMLTYAFLHYIIALAVWFGSLPFSAIPIPPDWTLPSLAVLAALYGALAYLYVPKIKN
jgi:competence protein ComEC